MIQESAAVAPVSGELHSLYLNARELRCELAPRDGLRGAA